MSSTDSKTPPAPTNGVDATDTAEVKRGKPKALRKEQKQKRAAMLRQRYGGKFILAVFRCPF